MGWVQEMDERIRRALRAIRLPYRARLTARDDAPGLQLAQAEGLAGEQAQAVEILQLFGLTSGTPAGSDCIVLPLAGRTSASVIIATEHAACRLKVGPGEVRMYSQEGAYIHIKSGRVVEVECDELAINVKNGVRLTAGQSVEISAGGGIRLDTPQTTVTGNPHRHGRARRTGGDERGHAPARQSWSRRAASSPPAIMWRAASASARTVIRAWSPAAAPPARRKR